MRKAGIEPARGCPQRILSPLRLPVPPYPQELKTEAIIAQKFYKVKSFLAFFQIFIIIPPMQTPKFRRTTEDFDCAFCGTHVKGNGYTNHCTECLSSLHVDVNPGDRASNCHGLMLADRLERKNGEMYIVHKCIRCGFTRRNKVNFQDNFDAILALSNGTIEEYRKNLLSTQKHTL